MMQSADLRNLYDWTHLPRLNGPRDRGILVQGEVSAGSFLVVEVRFQNAAQNDFV
jgi:hypothetical protein